MTVRVKRRAPKRKGNSIVEYEEMVDISTLNKFYKNPNIGDPEKTAESLKSNGQFRSIVVNRGTHTGRPNEILAGNHTYMGALKLGWKDILVGWVDVDNAKARAINLADNGARDGSTYDEQVLADLLSDHVQETGSLVGTTFTDEALDSLIKGVEADPNSQIDNISDAPDDDGSIFDFKNWVYFPSDQPYDMPELRLDMIPDEIPGPVDVWAGHELDLPRQEAEPDRWWLAMWHAGSRGINWKQAIPFFYTEDFHFEPVFTDPSKNTKKILNLGISMAIMPNFSINPDWPIATWIWAAYRSHFVARYWQEAGLQVIPDIQYGVDDVCLDITLLGIPENAPLVSCQVQNARGDNSVIRRTARLLKEAEDRLNFQHILVYGHTDADTVVDRAGFGCGVTRVAARTARRREYLNSGATINTVQVSKKRKRKVVVKK